eukprot:TRINITY_DN15041_c0_g1_i2.p2 TRINITY_DN15041_c0_g1~~TRINITY_DN15041_c0_g1_i2.p2  ORF type:complete len:173 (-),score=37.03 TRINITY_DN15041_c0_g1_i2:75-593(-)
MGLVVWWGYVVIGRNTPVDGLSCLDGVGGGTALRHQHPLDMLVWGRLMVLVMGVTVVGVVRGVGLLVVVKLLAVGWLVVGCSRLGLVLGLVRCGLVWAWCIDYLPVRVGSWLSTTHLMSIRTTTTTTMSSLMVLIVLRLSLIHISEPTRLLSISYAVFCLKKKKKKKCREKM